MINKPLPSGNLASKVSMEKLSDFKPLERVELPELGELDCSGLILIVGPNSSGKTQLLRDLYERIKGDLRKLVVAREIKLRKPDLDPFLSCLEREGYLTSFVDDTGTKRLRPMASYVGTGEAAQPIAFSQAQPWHQAYPEDTPDASPRRNEFLLYFGRFVVTTLFLDRRLLAVNQVQVIDFETQPLQQDLQALYLNDAARAELLAETENTFGRAFGQIPLGAPFYLSKWALAAVFLLPKTACRLKKCSHIAPSSLKAMG